MRVTGEYLTGAIGIITEVLIAHPQFHLKMRVMFESPTYKHIIPGAVRYMVESELEFICHAEETS